MIKKLEKLKDVNITFLDNENLMENQLLKYFSSKGLQIHKFSSFNENKIKNILESTDMVIFVYSNNEKLAFKINELCVKNNIPLLIARMLSNSCTIGPLVIPYKSACLKCYHLRLKSNNVKTKTSKIKEHFFIFRNTFTSYIFLELINFLALKSPLCLDNVLEIDFKNFSIEKHPLLKIPFCPICGGTYAKRTFKGE